MLDYDNLYILTIVIFIATISTAIMAYVRGIIKEADKQERDR